MTPAPIDPQLNQTPVTTTVVPKERSRTFRPVRVLVDMNLAAKFWCGMFVFVLLLYSAERLLATRSRHGSVIILDGSGAIITAQFIPFRDAAALHLQQATLATHTFLNRSPLDFDHPELLELMFLRDALAKARMQFAGEAAERAAKQIHQKAEIAKIDRLATRNNLLLIQVSGQLIRTGLFQDQPFAESVPFTLSLRMVRNPDLTHNGRFPTAVKDFTYEMGH